MTTTFRSKKDNAKSLITNDPLLSGGLSITLTATEGSKFPATGQFVVTLWDNTTYNDPGDDPTMEKILCDSISGDTITVNASGRGYDGTSGVAHPQGTRIALLNISKDFTDVETAVNTVEEKADLITPASASAPSSIDLAEDTDNGTNKITVTAPSSIASDKTITLPDATGEVALVTTLLEAIYPVGSIYISGSSTMPALISSIGTWTRLEGVVIVGASDTDTDFSNGTTGGHKEMQEHNHSASSNTTGSHTHTYKQATYDTSSAQYKMDTTDTNWTYPNSNTGIAGDHSHTITVDNEGTGDSGNLPPYKAKYMWERTA